MPSTPSPVYVSSCNKGKFARLGLDKGQTGNCFQFCFPNFLYRINSTYTHKAFISIFPHQWQRHGGGGIGTLSFAPSKIITNVFKLDKIRQFRLRMAKLQLFLRFEHTFHIPKTFPLLLNLKVTKSKQKQSIKNKNPTICVITALDTLID